MNLEERQFLEKRFNRLEDNLIKEIRTNKAETDEKFGIVFERLNKTDKSVANMTGKLTIITGALVGIWSLVSDNFATIINTIRGN
jgi:hypothetical protein